MSANLEHLYEQRKKLDFQNLFNRETRKKELARQKKGLKKERKRLKKETFEAPERDEEIERKVEQAQIEDWKAKSKFFSKEIFDVLDEADFTEQGKEMALQGEAEGPAEPAQIQAESGGESEDESGEEGRADSGDEGAFEDLLETEQPQEKGGRKDFGAGLFGQAYAGFFWLGQVRCAMA